MRKWILGAAAMAALLASSPAHAQAAASSAQGGGANQKALQLMLQKGVITQAEYDAAIVQVNEVTVKESSQTVVVEAEKKGPPPVTSKWNATMYGFVEADYMFDSTQSFQDLAGNGFIARGETYAALNHRMQYSIRNTRLGFRMNSPEWGGVKSSAVMEMDFFGNQPGTPPAYSEASYYNNPTFRIRHAYLKLESPVIDFLFGQTWELFGWQGYFHPNTVELQGVSGQVYSRTAQLRVSKTIKGDAVSLDIALDASRPPQRDSYVPDLQGGLKLSLNGWKGVTTNGGTGTNIVPFAIGVSGSLRRFQVQEPVAINPAPSLHSAVAQGWGYDIDILVPIIPVSDNNRANGLTFTGSFVNGRGINDFYTGLTGGATAANSGLTAPQADAALVGEVGFGADGHLRTIAWRSFIIGLQYYFPGDGRFWVSADYSNMYSSNVQFFGTAAGTFYRSNWAEANMFFDATNAIRLGLGYSWYRQYGTQANGTTPITGTNNRVQLSAWYLF